jgi:hypothetical protein
MISASFGVVVGKVNVEKTFVSGALIGAGKVKKLLRSLPADFEQQSPDGDIDIVSGKQAPTALPMPAVVACDLDANATVRQSEANAGIRDPGFPL